MLYSLSLFNERQEGFFIGLFASGEKARKVAEHYLSAVPGFRDDPCTFAITEKAVIGTIGPSRKVYMFWGWEEDAEGKETGIWSSECYADAADAQRALDAARERMDKQAWSLDTYRVGQCLWTEGVVRILDSEQEKGPQPDGLPMLPRGITGFGGAGSEPPPVLDEKAFRRMCHALAQANGGTVAEVDTDLTARNFYSAKICRYGDSVFLLQNAHAPYAAFARQDASGGFVLTRQPKWLQVQEGPVRFLSLAEWNQDWHGLCGELSPEEREQIRYWNARTVGEIIWNSWD